MRTESNETNKNQENAAEKAILRLKSEVSHNNNRLLLLNTVVAIASTVSLITTARGMSSFVFPDNPLMALGLSAVIQLSLVTISQTMSRKSGTEKKTDYRKLSYPDRLAMGCLNLLLFVPRLIRRLFSPLVLAWLISLSISASFSYLYISNAVYAPVWPTIAHSVLSSEYQNTLYSVENRTTELMYTNQDDIRTNAKSVYDAITKIQEDKKSKGNDPAIQLYSYDQTSLNNTFSNPDYNTASAIYSKFSALAANVVNYTNDNKNSGLDVGRLQTEVNSLTEDVEGKMESTETKIDDLIRERDEIDKKIVEERGKPNPSTTILNTLNADFDAKAAEIALERRNLNTYEEILSILRQMTNDLGIGNALVALNDLQYCLLMQNTDGETVRKMREDSEILVSSLQKALGTDGNAESLGSAQTLSMDIEKYLVYMEAKNNVSQALNSLSTLNDEIEKRITDRGGNVNDAADDNSIIGIRWQVESGIWRERLRNLSLTVTRLPDKDNSFSRGEIQEKMAELESFYVSSENEPLKMAINYLSFIVKGLTGEPSSFMWQAVLAVLLSVTIDCIPLALGKCGEIIRERQETLHQKLAEEENPTKNRFRSF